MERNLQSAGYERSKHDSCVDCRPNRRSEKQDSMLETAWCVSQAKFVRVVQSSTDRKSPPMMNKGFHLIQATFYSILTNLGGCRLVDAQSV